MTSYKANKLILIRIVLYNNLFLYQLSDVETQRKSPETIINLSLFYTKLNFKSLVISLLWINVNIFTKSILHIHGVGPYFFMSCKCVYRIPFTPYWRQLNMQQVGLLLMGLVLKKNCQCQTAYKIADFINIHYVNFVWYF